MAIPPLPGGVSAPAGKAKVLISFIHEEQKEAEAVQQFIEEVLRVKVFVSCDTRAIVAGEQWLERVRNALEGATVVLLMLSSASMGRPWVNFEAGAAWNRRTPIVPVCFNLRRDQLPKPYSDFQAVDLITEPYYLITSVGHHLNEVPPVCGEPQGAYSKLLAAL
jgi:hypothetical protein